MSDSLLPREFTTLLKISRAEFLELLRSAPEDYEHFVAVKDLISNLRNFEAVGMQCLSCGSNQHTHDNCVYLHLCLNRSRLVSQFNRDCLVRERQQHERKTPKIRTFEVRADLEECARDFQDEYEDECLEIESRFAEFPVRGIDRSETAAAAPSGNAKSALLGLRKGTFDKEKLLQGLRKLRGEDEDTRARDLPRKRLCYVPKKDREEVAQNKAIAFISLLKAKPAPSQAAPRSGLQRTMQTRSEYATMKSLSNEELAQSLSRNHVEIIELLRAQTQKISVEEEYLHNIDLYFDSQKNFSSYLPFNNFSYQQLILQFVSERQRSYLTARQYKDNVQFVLREKKIYSLSAQHVKDQNARSFQAELQRLSRLDGSDVLELLRPRNAKRTEKFHAPKHRTQREASPRARNLSAYHPKTTLQAEDHSAQKLASMRDSPVALQIASDGTHRPLEVNEEEVADNDSAYEEKIDENRIANRQLPMSYVLIEHGLQGLELKHKTSLLLPNNSVDESRHSERSRFFRPEEPPGE